MRRPGPRPSHFAQYARSVILMACGIFGGFFALIGILSAQERHGTLSWLASEAIITESRLSSSTSASRHGPQWFPSISVRYLDSNEEVRVAVAFGRWLGWGDQIRQSAERDVARYPAGRVVTVYHAPDDRHRAVLERLPWQRKLGWLAIGLGLLGFALLQLRRSRPART